MTAVNEFPAPLAITFQVMVNLLVLGIYQVTWCARSLLCLSTATHPKQRFVAVVIAIAVAIAA